MIVPQRCSLEKVRFFNIPSTRLYTLFHGPYKTTLQDRNNPLYWGHLIQIHLLHAHACAHAHCTHSRSHAQAQPRTHPLFTCIWMHTRRYEWPQIYSHVSQHTHLIHMLYAMLVLLQVTFVLLTLRAETGADNTYVTFTQFFHLLY